MTVDLEAQPSDMINLIMASGEYYDMIFTCEWLNNYDKNAAKGLYYDITDLVREETPGKATRAIPIPPTGDSMSRHLSMTTPISPAPWNRAP